ncbi:MAG: iron-sulfur cluster assembly scaffold protein [Sphingomonas sp.]|jgi:NifU-like protein involved in Fe-S cluster formation
MNAPLYTTEILRLAASLQEMRELEREDGRAELRSPTCGSRIVMIVELDGERRIRMISQQVNACAFGQAAAALVQQHSTGRAHDEIANALVAISRWLAKEQDEAGDWPGIETLAPARSRKSRHGAILLPFRALLAAIEAAR